VNIRRVLLALLLLVSVAAAQRAPGTPRPWEHESSDVPRNPRVHFGELDNGMRWAWMANGEPKQRCYVRLHVDVGSLGEEDSEQGMAHFLEHMAFNGSQHFLPGTLIEWFQRHGMAFGADSNASTNFSETVYMLDLPTSDATSLQEGLTFLRDVAGGLLLLPEEIEAEVGVIDGEERERDSAEFRAGIADLKDAFEGTRVAVRIPIGLPHIRANFTSDSVRAFWKRWYRPENMTLVIVGDLGELDPVPMLTRTFSDLPVPESPPEDEPALGTPPARNDVFVHFNAELPVVTLTAAQWKPWEDEPHTKAEMVEDLPREYARRMVNLRFRELAKKPDAPFLQARLGEAGGLRVAEGEELSVVAEPEDWKAALAAGEQELRRALQHGFRPQELDEVRKDALRSLDEAVEREGTRTSSSFAQEILAAAESRIVPTTAAADREILKPAIEALTPEGCRDALRKAWGEGQMRLSAVGGLDLGADGAKTLAETWAESVKVEVQAPPALSDLAFAYTSSAEDAGEVEHRDVALDLGVTQVRFANGVKLNIKSTDFRERQVMVSARLAGGLVSLPPERGTVAFMTGDVFAQGGLGKHSQDDVRRLLAGREAGVAFEVSEDACVLGGSTTPDDLLLQLELMCAYIQDPGWRAEALDQARRNLEPLYEQLAHVPEGPVQLSFLKRLHGDDPRFSLPPQAALMAVTMDEMRAWLMPLLASAPIELTIVGDVDVEATVAAAARTFGALPARGAAEDPADRLAVKVVTGLHDEATVPTELPQALLFMAVPTSDGRDARQRRQLSLLGGVVNDRLRVEVREKLGTSYSPNARSQVSQVFPGVGFILLNATSDPALTGKVLETCLSVCDSLAMDGVTAEELERQREPILKQLRDQLRRNNYWLSALGECQTRASALDDIRSLEADYQGITPETLSELAQKWLPRERASWIIVKPEPKPAPGP
jgi:zinc protease